MKISIVCSSETHPIYSLLETWSKRYQESGHEVSLVQRVSNLSGGDLLLLVSCGEMVGPAIRQCYSATLVLHASDLPQGRGWSPHIWGVLEGLDRITVTLLEAEDKVDSGEIWAQTSFSLEGHELYDEINQCLFKAELELMDFAVAHFGKVKPRKQPEVGVSYYPKRTPADSEINPHQPLLDSFNLLRVADPQRFPAFFYHHGHKFTIRIEKAD